MADQAAGAHRAGGSGAVPWRDFGWRRADRRVVWNFGRKGGWVKDDVDPERMGTKAGRRSL